MGSAPAGGLSPPGVDMDGLAQASTERPSSVAIVGLETAAEIPLRQRQQRYGNAEALLEIRGAPRGAMQPGGMEGPTCGLSQQAAEAGGSLALEAQGQVGAASTTTGRAGTARRPGSGKQDGEVYECRNQWWNPLKSGTGSNLVDLGR